MNPPHHRRRGRRLRGGAQAPGRPAHGRRHRGHRHRAGPAVRLAQDAARWPDVVVLDVEMPRMDGISFLRKLMAERPTPVVMCSTLTEPGARPRCRPWPKARCRSSPSPRWACATSSATRPTAWWPRCAPPRQQPARHAATPRPQHPEAARRRRRRPARPAGPTRGAMAETTDRIVAIGSSTGGVQAIEALLRGLPRTAPGHRDRAAHARALHRAFAERLDACARWRCARPRRRPRAARPCADRAGRAPHAAAAQRRAVRGERCATARWSTATSPRSTCCSSRWRTAPAQCGGHHAHRHGRRRRARPAGDAPRRRRTAAQDEASCVVFGMPREADPMLGAAAGERRGGVCSAPERPCRRPGPRRMRRWSCSAPRCWRPLPASVPTCRPRRCTAMGSGRSAACTICSWNSWASRPPGGRDPLQQSWPTSAALVNMAGSQVADGQPAPVDAHRRTGRQPAQSVDAIGQLSSAVAQNAEAARELDQPDRRPVPRKAEQGHAAMADTVSTMGSMQEAARAHGRGRQGDRRRGLPDQHAVAQRCRRGGARGRRRARASPWWPARCASWRSASPNRPTRSAR
jgi:two-component system chemotaxis response regulator CheB